MKTTEQGCRGGQRDRVGARSDCGQDCPDSGRSGQPGNSCWTGEAGGEIDLHALEHSWTCMLAGASSELLAVGLAMRPPSQNGHRQIDGRP